jgi:dTDP-4-dehydrorhamnose reductase
MRILVTGVSGQVGGALLPRLQGLRLQGLRSQALATTLAADRAVLDLSMPLAIPDTLDRLAPDMIVNPAAYTAVDKAEDEPALAMRVNAEAPGVIARWAAARHVPLIHFSTDYVFDGSGERAWREDDRPHPLSAYGVSKLAGEDEVRAAGGTALIVRTSWVYAAAGKNFLRTIARLARERAELRIVADQIGAPTSAALIADTIARMLSDGIESLRARCTQSGGLVHVAAAGATSWHGFACAIVEGLRERGIRLAAERVAPISTDQYPTKARRPLNSRLDLTRLQSAFGMMPPHWQMALSPELDQLAAEFSSAPDGG